MDEMHGTTREGEALAMLERLAPLGGMREPPPTTPPP